MQEKQLFEYAVIRVVPRVEREEFLNVGIILYCAKSNFLQASIIMNEKRLYSLSSDIDLYELTNHLDSFVKICSGSEAGGPIAQLDLPSRFRWLTAVRSTVVQTSRVHPGLCIDPQETLSKLLLEQVI